MVGGGAEVPFVGSARSRAWVWFRRNPPNPCCHSRGRESASWQRGSVSVRPRRVRRFRDGFRWWGIRRASLIRSSLCEGWCQVPSSRSRAGGSGRLRHLGFSRGQPVDGCPVTACKRQERWLNQRVADGQAHAILAALRFAPKVDSSLNLNRSGKLRIDQREVLASVLTRPKCGSRFGPGRDSGFARRCPHNGHDRRGPRILRRVARIVVSVLL